MELTYINGLSSQSHLMATADNYPLKPETPDKLKILVVEDELINQIVAKSALEAMGYAVDIAENGVQALQLYQESSYSLILMDMGLPDMPGTAITEKIRALESTDYHIPIIAYTANGKKCEAACLASGMDDFAQKPLPFEALQTLIHQYITQTGATYVQ